MKHLASLIFLAAASISISSCVTGSENTVAGPTSDTSKIPWNAPVAGQGQGQMGMMPQNQYRR